MKYFLGITMLSFFLISCGSSRPSGYVQTSSNTTVYVKPNANKRLGNTARRSINNDRINGNDTYIINDSAEFGDSRPDAIFNQKTEIIDFAKSFKGTRYKYGGTTKAGMDCSGLVCTAFEVGQISLPRSSRDMALEGTRINLREVEPGDLVFFKTTKRNVISHVGIVVEISDGIVQFIHSSTQAGVIISSLDEAYWKKAFVEVRRVI